MKPLLFIAMLALASVLSGCGHYLKVKPGSPPPTVSLNPARASDRQFVPRIAEYFQKAGYRVVRGGPSDYDLNYSVSDQGVYVQANMILYGHGETVSDGSAKATARSRYADPSAVANEAVDDCLDDLEVPVVRATRSRSR